MIRTLGLLALVVLILGCAPARESARVVRVIDGDTIVVLLDGEEERVRYIGIDTPELGTMCGVKARLVNSLLVSGKVVQLEKDVSERDRYGRLLRYVYADGVMVNARLVEEGHAKVATYPPDVKYRGLFLRLLVVGSC